SLKLCTVCQSKKKFPRKAIVVCPIVSSDFNHRAQVDLQSTPDRNAYCKDLPAAGLINNNVSTLEDLPATGLINNNPSTSKLAASTATTPVLFVASEREAVDREEKAFCIVCGMESTEAHLCDICINGSRRRIWVENSMLLMPERRKYKRTKRTCSTRPKKIC
ncbi:hypothetical protein ILUMI_20542, partial [Ignelater luminosus]